jgi:phosphatidylserine decarboxylase
MTARSHITRLFDQEDLNFLLTNRIPRRLATQFIGWFSKIEQPVVRDLSIGLWRMFSDLDLSDAKKSHFRSMHDCFVRELKDGARPVDPDPKILVSPCDAIIGANGTVADTLLYQVKGFPYTLEDLMGDRKMVDLHRNARYVTLRLKSSMYHRFHAPVAAILVAAIRLHFLDVLLSMKHRGPNVFPCDTRFRKGAEMGWFEHGSTIIVFAHPDLALCDAAKEGATIRMGEPLMRLP